MFDIILNLNYSNKKLQEQRSISMQFQKQLISLIQQNSPQVDWLRSRAISGNKQTLISFCNVIKHLLKDPSKHHVAYRQVNELLITARPEVISQVDDRVVPDLLQLHNSQNSRCNQYILLWARMMPGTNKIYPNFNNKFKQILAQQNNKQLSDEFSKYSYQFSKNYQNLFEQKVQFFEDSYRNSIETKNMNSVQHAIDSYKSQSVSSQIIEKDVQIIEKIRMEVEAGPIEQKQAQKYLRIIKKFLSHKPRTLKKTLSLNFNDDRIWAQEFADNYEKHLQNGSLHLYRHFKKSQSTIHNDKGKPWSFMQRSDQKYPMKLESNKKQYYYEQQSPMKKPSKRFDMQSNDQKRSLTQTSKEVFNKAKNKFKEISGFEHNQNNNFNNGIYNQNVPQNQNPMYYSYQAPSVPQSQNMNEYMAPQMTVTDEYGNKKISKRQNIINNIKNFAKNAMEGHNQKQGMDDMHRMNNVDQKFNTYSHNNPHMDYNPNMNMNNTMNINVSTMNQNTGNPVNPNLLNTPNNMNTNTGMGNSFKNTLQGSLKHQIVNNAKNMIKNSYGKNRYSEMNPYMNGYANEYMNDGMYGMDPNMDPRMYYPQDQYMNDYMDPFMDPYADYYNPNMDPMMYPMQQNKKKGKRKQLMGAIKSSLMGETNSNMNHNMHHPMYRTSPYMNPRMQQQFIQSNKKQKLSKRQRLYNKMRGRSRKNKSKNMHSSMYNLKQSDIRHNNERHGFRDDLKANIKSNMKEAFKQTIKSRLLHGSNMNYLDTHSRRNNNHMYNSMYNIGQYQDPIYQQDMYDMQEYEANLRRQKRHQMMNNVKNMVNNLSNDRRSGMNNMQMHRNMHNMNPNMPANRGSRRQMLMNTVKQGIRNSMNNSMHEQIDDDYNDMYHTDPRQYYHMNEDNRGHHTGGMNARGLMNKIANMATSMGSKGNMRNMGGMNSTGNMGNMGNMGSMANMDGMGNRGVMSSMDSKGNMNNMGMHSMGNMGNIPMMGTSNNFSHTSPYMNNQIPYDSMPNNIPDPNTNINPHMNTYTPPTDPFKQNLIQTSPVNNYRNQSTNPDFFTPENNMNSNMNSPNLPSVPNNYPSNSPTNTNNQPSNNLFGNNNRKGSIMDSCVVNPAITQRNMDPHSDKKVEDSSDQNGFFNNIKNTIKQGFNKLISPSPSKQSQSFLTPMQNHYPKFGTMQYENKNPITSPNIINQNMHSTSPQLQPVKQTPGNPYMDIEKYISKFAQSPNFQSISQNNKQASGGYSRGLKQLPIHSRTQQQQLNQSEVNTYNYNQNKHSPMHNVTSSEYYSQTTPYNYNNFNQNFNSNVNQAIEKKIIQGLQGIQPIQPVDNQRNTLFSSKSEDNLFNTRSKPKIFNQNKKQQDLQIFIKKYGSSTQQNFPIPSNPENPQLSHSDLVPNRNSNPAYTKGQNKNPKTFTQYSNNQVSSYDYDPGRRLIIPSPNYTNRQTFLSDYTPRSVDYRYFTNNSMEKEGRQYKNWIQNNNWETNQKKLINLYGRYPKLSAYNQEKNTRKQALNQQQIKQIEQYILAPYTKNFNQHALFNNFRKNCLQNSCILYKNKQLEIICRIEKKNKTKIRVQMIYNNLSSSDLCIETLYRIPKCMDVHKYSVIKKRTIIFARQRLTHLFGLQLISFPLQPCLLNMRYIRTQQQSESAIKSHSPEIFNLPITIRNFLNFLVLNTQQFQQIWQQWNQSNHYSMNRNILLDKSYFCMEEQNPLQQFIELPATEGYSCREFGGFCAHQGEFKRLGFLIRIACRFNNVATITILTNKKIIDHDQKDYLEYCLNIWAMLIAKLDSNALA